MGGEDCFSPTHTIPYGVLRSAASPGSVGSSVEKLDQKWPPRTIPGFSTDPCYQVSIIQLTDQIRYIRKQKSRLLSRLPEIQKNQILLDFCFFEFNVLFGNRVVLALDHFLGHRAAVFLGNIEETGVGGAFKLDFDCCGLCHDLDPVSFACSLEEKANRKRK